MRISRAMSAALIALACSGFASAASAQGLSRAGVRQQLAEAEANGSGSVSNASYPDVSRMGQKSVAQVDGYGPAISGSSAAGSGPMTNMHRVAPDNCVGPASFCAIYFGS